MLKYVFYNRFYRHKSKFILVNKDFISVNPCSIEQEFPEPESYQHEAKSKANS
jgi:hypothetical protein